MALNYPMWTAGQTMLETADRLSTEEATTSDGQYLLLLGALRTLVANEHEPAAVLDSYLLRAMSLAGYEPTLDSCVLCGEMGRQPFFHVGSGGAICVNDRVPGSVAPKNDSWELLEALLRGNWTVVDGAHSSCRAEVSGIVSAFVQWHIERGLRSLPLVDRKQ